MPNLRVSNIIDNPPCMIEKYNVNCILRRAISAARQNILSSIIRKIPIMSNADLAKEQAKLTWGASPAGSTFAKGYKKGTKEFFEAVLEKRFSTECVWLDDIVQFKQFSGKNVLEIGCGAGYDAYFFCKYGALYTGIDITPDNPVITRDHLTQYGYKPTVYELDVEELPFQNTFDLVYSFGVLHHVPNITQALQRCFDALKPGGELLIFVYNKNSIFYRLTVVLCNWILSGKFLSHTLASVRSDIEYTSNAGKPLVNVYSKKEISQLVQQAGFGISNIYIRKLAREDLPDIPLIRYGYRFAPTTWLERLGNHWGWYIGIHAIKNS